MVNSGGSSEPAGYYYNSSGQQVYYYGNGTYYNPTTGTYGGTAFSSSTTGSGSNTTNTTGSTMTNTGTTNTGGTDQTPLLYSQSGQVVNSGGTSEPAGYYYNASGQQIYYYGNGTYYDPSTGTYGGQAFGTTASSASAPGVPNTGAGGDAAYTWLALLVSAAIAAGGVLYLSRRSSIAAKAGG